MRLLKGVYGYETSPKKTPFGLLNEQQRIDQVVKNGFWFNYDGEKIGRGDLNMADLANISKHIPEGEAFFVLSEGDALWDMPAGLDRSEPGMDYILKTAIWVISRPTGIVRVRDNIQKGDVGASDGVKYNRIPRAEFEKAFVTKPKSGGISATSKKAIDALDAALDAAAKLYPKTSAKKSIASAAQPLIYGSLGHSIAKSKSPSLPKTIP